MAPYWFFTSFSPRCATSKFVELKVKGYLHMRQALQPRHWHSTTLVAHHILFGQYDIIVSQKPYALGM